MTSKANCLISAKYIPTWKCADTPENMIAHLDIGESWILNESANQTIFIHYVFSPVYWGQNRISLRLDAMEFL